MAGRPKTRTEFCSKCGERPYMKGQAYCAECLGQYRRERLVNAERLMAAKHFSRGVEAFAKTLADEFLRFDRDMGGNALVACDRVADIITRAPRPSFEAIEKLRTPAYDPNGS